MALKKRSRGGKGVSSNQTSDHHSHSRSDASTNHNNGTLQQYPAPVPAQRLDPQEAARLIKRATVDPSTQIVRHLAIFRLIIFLLLVHTYVRYLPHPEVNRHVDSWLTYEQFEFFYLWAPKQGNWGAQILSWATLTCAVFFGMLSAMGGVNGLPKSFRVSGSIFLSCFAFRFFMFAHSFSDRHYLLFLLGVILVVSGGGGFFLIFTEVEPQMTEAQQKSQRLKRQLLIQSSEWGAITLRLQFAVVYLFSSLWKLHFDYLQGDILRGHLLGFDDEQATLPAWLWIIMGPTFRSQFFQIIGMVGFVMDFGMFLALTFRKPTDETSRSFVASTLTFHTIVALTAGGKIGYSFPISCFAGILIFHPIGGGSKVGAEINSATTDQSAIKKRIRSRLYSAEANLTQWVYRYATGSPESRATRRQQVFTIVWLVVQIVLPLRMPLISSFNYPFTAQGYRFSWTMMLHSRQTTINHVGKYTAPGVNTSPVVEQVIPLHLFYVVPECSGKRFQRKDYMPERAVATEDPRTLPIDSVLTDHQKAFVRAYPRYIAHVAGGMSMVVRQIGPEACAGAHVSVFGVHFAKLNGKGAYCRVLDPTVDLSLAEAARHHRPIWEILWGIVFDKAPSGHEYLLPAGIGSMNQFIDRHRLAVETAARGAQRIEFVADRAPCLVFRPLSLWPNGYPIRIMLLEAPSSVIMSVTAQKHSEAASTNLTVTAGNQWDVLDPPERTVLRLNTIQSVTAVSVEISLSFFNGVPAGTPYCINTIGEDILFALIFMS